MPTFDSQSTRPANSAAGVGPLRDHPCTVRLHELRQPVTTLGLLNHALLNADDPVIRRDIVQQMAQAIAELNRLLDQSQQAPSSRAPVAPVAPALRSTATAAPSTGGSPAEGAFTNLSGLCVMVIDDHESVRQSLRTLLELQLAEVHTFGDPQSAMLWLQSSAKRPNAALIDHQLKSDIDGLQLVFALRGVLPDLAMLLTTGDNDPALADRARAAGVDVALKPIRPHDISAWLRRTAAAGQPPDRPRA